MKLCRLQCQGFTIAEMGLAASVGSLMLASIVAASVCLQRSFTAVDNFFSSHMQQVRMIDYLNRDVKRSYVVTTSADLQTVACIIPNYLVDHPSNQPTRADPTLSLVGKKIIANYQATTVDNVTTTQGSTALSCLGSSRFDSTKQGKSVVGTGIPAGTTLVSFSGCTSATNCSQATMSNPAGATNSSATVTIGVFTNVVYSVVNQAIQRRENGGLTNIVVGADSLIPVATDVELSNTEFTQSTVTFLWQFVRGDQTFLANERAATAVFSLSYLRNRRRGDG
jgi:hypothetical protein